MTQKQMRKKFLIILLAYVVSAASVLLAPFAVGKDGDLNTLGYVSGAMFWAGLIIGIAGYVWMSKKAEIPEMEGKKLPSVLRFFSNPPAMAADVMLIAGIAGMVFCRVAGHTNVVIQEICLLCLLIGIYGHVLLNGRIYRYIWESAGKPSALSQDKGGIRE